MASRIGGLVGDQNLNIHFNEASQIPQQQTTIRNFTSQSLIGKRTLAEFQAQQQMNISPALNRNSLLYLRSIKPRMYQHASSVEFASSANLSSPELLSLSQRHRVPLLQQLRPHPAIRSVNNHILSGVPNYVNALQSQYGGGARVDMGGQETENKMMNKLLELEKQLLDDNDEDAVSVITDANSEWSEIIQNLINPISSPVSSSSSSSASVTTPLPNFSKQTIVEAASTIYEGKSDAADEILSHLTQVSNPRGNSSQRFIGYMSTALKSCLHSAENPPPVAELYGQEHIASALLLYRVSPCFELGIMAANLAILDSTIMQQPNRENGFHVIDFDIGQGCQYMKLLRALSERTNGNSATVKLTAVTDYNSVDDKERLKVVGTTLCQLAEQLGVSLRFNVVSCKIGNLSRESLGCEPDEPLAVNFAFSLYRLPDESVSTDNPRDELLRRVKALAPQVVTLVEQEINTNTAPFLTRVNEVSSYYGALFESIESTMQSDNTDRVRVEKGLARKLANSIACEGRDRLERCEVFGKWRARMGMAGFESKPMSQNITDLIKARLNNANWVNPGFTIREESGGVSFGWMGKALTVASAWR